MCLLFWYKICIEQRKIIMGGTMFPKNILCFCLVVLLSASLFATAVGDEFMAAIQQVNTDAEAMTKVREYLPRMTDLQDLRGLQNVWMRVDNAACTAYFENLHRQNPQSSDYHYLWVRTLNDDYVQITEARAMIAANPSFYWGYRVMYAAYLESLFAADADEELKSKIAKELPKDRAALHQGLDRFPGDDYALMALFNLYNYEKNYPEAERYVIQVKDGNALSANMDSIMEFIRESKRMAAFSLLVPRMISTGIQKGEVESADSLDVYNTYYLYMLSQTERWQDMDKFFSGNPQYKDNPRYADALMEAYIKNKKFEQAMDYIEAALARKEISFTDLRENIDWAELHENKRWKATYAKAKADFESDEPARRAKAVSKRIDKPAPLWEFPDINGKMVKLSELRGQLVLLDFWATWCSPCRSTMPLLDKWMDSRAAKDVKVFSVNVWERDPPAAVKYMQDKKFRMTYLAGDDEVSKNYKFDGIPYLCLIDAKGNLVFEHSGYSEDLAETLSFWVEELRK